MKEKVYAYLKTIPKGKVTTYGRIAEYLGNKHCARTVGNILHENPDPTQIPCHRVVNSKGRVAEHYAFGGAAAQRIQYMNAWTYVGGGVGGIKSCYHPD